MSGTRKMEKFDLEANAEGQPAPDDEAEASAERAAPIAEPTPRNTGSLDNLRTQQAQKFVTLADSVTASFEDFAIGAGAWTVELTQPQGPSTGGGQQALQHLRMRPRRSGFSVLVAGAVNPMAKLADLRDYDHIEAIHEVRHRHSLPITRQEWEQFLRKAEVVLNAGGIQSMRTPPPRELLDQRRSMQRVSQKAVVAFVVVSILALIVAWRVVVALLAHGAT